MFKSKINFLIIFFSLFISSSAFPDSSCMGGFDISLFKKQIEDSLARVLKPEAPEKVQLEACGPLCLRLVSETSLGRGTQKSERGKLVRHGSLQTMAKRSPRYT